MKLSKFSLFMLPTLIKVPILMFIFIPITTFFLDVEDFAVFALLNVIAGFLVSISDIGGVHYLIFQYFKTKIWERSILVFNIVLLTVLPRALLILILFLISEYTLPHLIKGYKNEYSFYLNIVYLSLIFSSLNAICQQLMILRENEKLFAFLELSKTFINVFVASILLFFLNMDVLALFLSMLALNVFSFIFEIIYIYRIVEFKIKKKFLFNLVFIGIPVWPSNVIDHFTASVDKYLINQFVNMNELGIYSHSQIYFNFFKYLAKAYTRSITLDTINSLENKLGTREIQQNLFFWYLIVIWLGLFSTLFSYDILNLLTNGKFVEAAPLVTVWVLIMLSNGFSVPGNNFLILNKKTKTLSTIQIISNFISIIVTFIGVYFFGILGAAFSVIITNYLLQIFIYKLSRHHTNLEFVYFLISTVTVIFFTFFTQYTHNINLYIRLIILLFITLIITFLINKYLKQVWIFFIFSRAD